MKTSMLIPLVLTIVALAQTHSPAAEVPDVWKPFQFLMGDWVGTGSEKSNQGAGEFSLKFDLDKKILVRKNWAKLGQGAKQPSSGIHEDLMIIYPQQGTHPFRAEYFDNEGNVIHYGVSLREHVALFESGESASPRFRLTYELNPDGTLHINFAIASPGKPFQTCLSGVAKRK